MEYLFQCARAANDEIISIKFSAIEIYNDIASDLLRPQASKDMPKLLIVDSPSGIIVPELFLVPISNAEEGFGKLVEANASRYDSSLPLIQKHIIFVFLLFRAVAEHSLNRQVYLLVMTF
jgi:hypothetical protein